MTTVNQTNQLSKLACENENKLRSIEGGSATSINFVNKTSALVKVYWINYQGQRQLYKDLKPGESFTQSTYVNHPWVATDEQGVCLGIFQPEGEPKDAIIENQLPKLACENENKLRSLEGGAATSINFVNKTSALVKVYWINYQGQRQLYKDLKSEESFTQSTYINHPWVVTDEQGGCLGIFQPEGKCKDAIVESLSGQGQRQGSSTQAPSAESSQTRQIGKIVVNADEWTLSNTGFTQAPDTTIFVTNIAKWFTAGRSTGKFHAYSTNFGLTESVLAQTIAKAGYTWTSGKNIKFDLPTLLTYDGIFLCGDLADNQVLIDYVKAGGNVYLGAGTGSGGPQQEANNWNTFLNAFGLKLLGIYNSISGNQSVNSSHPVFAGVKAIYQNNGNSIVDLDPASQTNQIILTHTNGEGLTATFEGSEKINTPSSQPLESSQTIQISKIVVSSQSAESSQTRQIGKIVVNADEWTLSNTGFTQAPDTATFVTNIAKWFTAGRSTGKFHAYSTNFGLTESLLAQTIAKAGYTWTSGKNIKFDLPTLLTYDGIFLCGDLADNQVLIDYVKAGGNVYLGAGTGSGGPQQEANNWNTFLNAFGLKLLGIYNSISGNQSVNSSHPVFAGVKAIYQNNGNSIVDLDPASQTNQIILTHTNGEGLTATFEGSEKINTPSSQPLESSQTIQISKIVVSSQSAESSQTRQIGKIVVNADEWTLSNTGFTQAPDTATFVTNIAKWFTAGRSTGKFHAYSTNFGLTESLLAQTIAKAGYTWTSGKNIKFDLPTLLTYDGIFLCGDLADNQVLIDYVKAGGNVYLGAGNLEDPQQEASNWNTFLNAFGLKLSGVYNEIRGNQAVNSSHPIFAGVKAIYQNNSNPIVNLAPASQTTELLLTQANGQGLIAVVAGSEKTSTPLSRPVAFKVPNGQYLVAENGGGGLLLANSSRIKTWEAFRLITLENGKVALQAPLKQEYLSVLPDGNFTWVGNIKEYEMFDLVQMADNKVALKSHHGKYISIQEGGGGTVIANGLVIKEWEILELIELDPSISNQKKKKDKEGKNKKANTIILEFNSHKKKDIRDFAQGRGRLFKKVAKTIAELQKSGEIDDGVQPVITIISQKKSTKAFWD